jgi:hypothetical protein
LISAEKLARSRPSYWQELAPRTESFVRAMNLGIGRFAPPIPPEVEPRRRAFVAEIGFALFRQEVSAGSRDWRGAVSAVSERIARVSPESNIAPPGATEQDQAERIGDKLVEFALRRGEVQLMTVDPIIPGCGVVYRATADLMIKRRAMPEVPGRARETRELFEVKATERPFRSEDIRQLLTYAALLWAAEGTPDRLGLVNPRLGTFGEWSPEELAQDIAGVTASILFHQIVFDISEAGAST